MQSKDFKRKKIITICALGLVFLLAGCGDTNEEKAQRRAYEKQAEENAVEYVKQKYGIAPDVRSSDCENASSGSIPNISPNSSGNVYVTLEYDETTFSVYISGEGETTDGIDNYQLSEVTKAVEDYLKAITSNPAEEIVLCYGAFLSNKTTRAGNGMVETYFDGTNLEEVLTEDNLRIAVSYINEDLSGINPEEIKEELGNGDYLLISYNSLEDYQNHGKVDYTGKSSFRSGLIEKGMHLKEYLYLDEYNEEYIQFDIKEQEGIYYTTQKNGEPINLEKTQLDDPTALNGNGFHEAKQLTDAYEIVSDAEIVHFYIPLELLGLERRGDASLVVEYKKDGEIHFEKLYTSETEDEQYITGSVDMLGCEDVKIAVLVSIGL